MSETRHAPLPSPCLRSPNGNHEWTDQNGIDRCAHCMLDCEMQTVVADAFARHTFIQLRDLVTPKTGECLVGHWWVTHPALGAVLVGGYPQCNRDETIARAVGAKLYPGWPVLQVPVAYLGRQP